MKIKIFALAFAAALALSMVASVAAAPPRQSTMCHTDWFGRERTIIVSPWTARFHERHGDTPGPCEGDPAPETICHTTWRGREVSLVVWPRAFAAHMRHGDTVGACGEDEPQDGSEIG